jgi:chromate reductase
MIDAAFKRHTELESGIEDLIEYELPFLSERLKFLENPAATLSRFGEMIENSSGLVVVSPEYNGACPGVLKNALDHLNDEYVGLPVGIVTVSAGPHGGDACFGMLHTLFRRVDARPLDFHLKITRVDDSVREDGTDVSGMYETDMKTFVERLASLITEGKQAG